MKTIVVLPAYNAEKTLEKTISEIPMEAVNEIILVDDASSDRTFEIAKTLRAGGLPITAKKHSRNSGYGANQKTCYRLAMDRGAEIVVMLHPDYQYDPKLIRYFVEFISKGYFDVMLGARIRSRKECLEGGMPGYKYYSNRFLSIIENIATGRNLSEWHTGMRAYKTEVLRIFLSKHSQMTLFLIHRFFWQLRKTIFISAISLCPCGILKKHRPSTFCAVRGTVFLRSGRSPNFWQEDRSAGLKFEISVNLINGRYSHFKFGGPRGQVRF